MTTSSPSVAEANRIPALDGLRGIAILIVMCFHLYALPYYWDGQEATNQIDKSFLRVLQFGWSGVDLFFVLSGFLITGILYDAKNSQGYFRSFFARRFLRIFPLYYGFLFFMLFISTRDPGSLVDNQWWYWSYLSNLGHSIEGWTSPVEFGSAYAHFWSLAVEEQFYLVWPFVVLALSRTRLMTLCIALTVVAFAFRVYLVSDISPDYFKINAPYMLTLARVDTLALGAFIALAARDPAGLTRLRPAALIAGGIAAFIVVLFVALNHVTLFDKYVHVFGFSATAFFYASCLLLLLTMPASGRIHGLLSIAPLRAFGAYSYGLYVVHPLVGHVILQRVTDRYDLPLVLGLQLPLGVMFLALTITASFGVAWLSWHLYEKHFLKLKRFFPYGRTPDERAPTPHTTPPPEPELAASRS